MWGYLKYFYIYIGVLLWKILEKFGIDKENWNIIKGF